MTIDDDDDRPTLGEIRLKRELVRPRLYLSVHFFHRERDQKWIGQIRLSGGALLAYAETKRKSDCKASLRRQYYRSAGDLAALAGKGFGTVIGAALTYPDGFQAGSTDV